MNDIGKELYERVRADFERRLKSDKSPPKDMRGMSDYSARVGRYLAEAIAANVTEDALPDRRLYYNIAESILEPSLRTNYELVNDTAAEVQRLLDERQGLHIKPARAEYPTERVHAVIGAASEEGIDFDRALRRMTSPAENITQSFADDFMQANAAQRSKAGFDTFIERQGGLNCCPWCAGLVGVFAYPKGLPKEVFARHDNCTCSVTYGTKGGARQNVWTKAKWEVPPVQEPHRMTAEEAAEKGAFAEPRRLTGGANGGIINDEQRSKSYNDLIARLSSLGIVNNPTSLFSERPSEELIIGRLAGGDMTEGACTSLAWAYAGNKGGVDVLDFRGGVSCDFFARTLNSQTIANFDGVISYTERNTNDFNAVTELLKKVESSKEYILITGKHTAVIKKSNKGFEYLEMQSATDNGFKPLTNAALKSRFGCKKTHKSYGYAMQASSILLDRQSLSDSDEFLSILGYINTPIDQQMKGDEGHEK